MILFLQSLTFRITGKVNKYNFLIYKIILNYDTAGFSYRSGQTYAAISL